MTTLSIVHRPASYVAAAAVVGAIALGSVALSVSHHADQTIAPGGTHPPAVGRVFVFQPTTSGGHLTPGA